MTSLLRLAAGCVVALCAAVASGEELMVFAGDGLRLVVQESEGDGGSIRGELRAGRNSYPFQARFDDDGEVLIGSCRIDGQAAEFRATQNLDDGSMKLTLRGRTYSLRVAEADSPDIAGRPAELGGAAPAPPRDLPVAPPPPRDVPAGIAGNTAVAGGKLPDQLRLKQVTFPDVNMGGVVAYSMLVPEGWPAQGVVEWRGSPTPFAQRNIMVQSPDGCAMEFPFNANFQYLEYSQQAMEMARQLGQQIPEQRQGVPPPRDAGQWICQIIGQRPGVQNARVVSQQRDRRSEQAFADQMRRVGAEINMDVQCWVVRADYVQKGRPMSEEVIFMLQINPALQDQQFVSVMWGAIFEVAWRAPADRFETMRPVFQTLFRSLRPDPRWFTQSMEIRTQLMRQQTLNLIEELKRRAGEYNRQLTASEVQAAQSKNAADDEAHRLRINAIAETHDYADKDGTRVNVPIHYKSVFGDGKGNYVLTNDSFQPGGEFAELKPWR